jgi:hypothetical protein
MGAFLAQFTETSRLLANAERERPATQRDKSTRLAERVFFKTGLPLTGRRFLVACKKTTARGAEPLLAPR